jgi:formylglycine-generating enzyme required for sulfatase activity
LINLHCFEKIKELGRPFEVERKQLKINRFLGRVGMCLPLLLLGCNAFDLKIRQGSPAIEIDSAGLGPSPSNSLKQRSVDITLKEFTHFKAVLISSGDCEGVDFSLAKEVDASNRRFRFDPVENAENAVCVIGRYKDGTWLKKQQAAKSETLIIQTIAPELSLSSPSAGAFMNSLNQKSFLMAGECSEKGQRVRIWHGTNLLSEVDCGKEILDQWSAEVDVSSVSDGAVILRITHQDALGNEAPTLTRSFTKKTTLPTASIELPEVTTKVTLANQGIFLIQGHCSEDGRAVSVTAKDGEKEEVVECGEMTPGQWQAELNLFDPGAVSVTVKAVHADEAGNPSDPATRIYEYDVDACSLGFIPVLGNSALGTSGFCVMKFEAKKVDVSGTDRPVSQPGEIPWTTINADDAKVACTDLGAGYDLISNPEWMTIARDAENHEENWSGGIVGSGMMPRGHSEGDTPLGVFDIADPWDGTGSDDEDDPGEGWEQRRTLKLSTEEEIWDFSGNVWSWVDWTVGGDLETGPNDCDASSYDLNDEAMDLLFTSTPECSLDLDQDLLPYGNYVSSKGVGKFHGGTGGAASRGGSWGSGINAGAFSLNLSFLQTAADPEIGFRCVYRP